MAPHPILPAGYDLQRAATSPSCSRARPRGHKVQPPFSRALHTAVPHAPCADDVAPKLGAARRAEVSKLPPSGTVQVCEGFKEPPSRCLCPAAPRQGGQGAPGSAALPWGPRHQTWPRRRPGRSSRHTRHGSANRRPRPRAQRGQPAAPAPRPSRGRAEPSSRHQGLAESGSAGLRLPGRPRDGGSDRRRSPSVSQAHRGSSPAHATRPGALTCP